MKFYKYTNFIDRKNIENVINNKIWLKKATEFNDPFDSDFYYDKNKIIKFAYKHPINSAYIFSLSAKNKNILMWSHYADNHKGFCIEYEINNNDYYKSLYESTTILGQYKFMVTLEKIKYKKKKFDATKSLLEIDDIINNKDHYNNSDLKKIYNFTLEMFTTKHKSWFYEKEHRLIIPTAYFPEKNWYDKGIEFPAPNITRIFYGAKSDEVLPNKKILENICKERNIPIYKMKLDEKEYRLYDIKIY